MKLQKSALGSDKERWGSTKERVGDVNVDDRGLWREPKESRIVDIVVEVRGKLARDVLEKCLVFFLIQSPLFSSWLRCRSCCELSCVVSHNFELAEPPLCHKWVRLALFLAL